MFQIYRKNKMNFALRCISLLWYRRFITIFFAVFLTSIYTVEIFAQDDAQKADPIKLFNQGQEAHEKGQFQTAIGFYENALKVNPEFPEAEYQRGSAYLSLGKTNEAEKSFRHAIELRENWTLPMTSLGSLLVQENNFAEAEKILTKVIELDEKDSEAYVSLSELYLRTKPTPEVLKGFLSKLQNLTSQPNPSASLWAARGAIELALQDKESAQKSLNNALAINPNNDYALSESAELLLANNDFAGAIERAGKLTKILPNSANAKLLLARAYAKSGNATEALKILEGLDSSNPNVASLKNSLLINNSQDNTALEQLLEKDPKNLNILSRLCNLSRVSNPQKALEYCRRASEIEPNNLTYVIAFGAALVQAKQLDNAISLFRKVLQMAPDNYTAHANLAAALFESKHLPEAKIEYEWLTKAKPDLAITYYLLAITQDQTEEYIQARENYQKFLQLADAKQNQLEIDKVNLRLPSLETLIKQKPKGKK